MQLRHEDAARFLQTHNGVLGAGWKEVQSFEELEDEEEFEEEEEEEYITLDMGNGVDARYLQTEATFQLIGLDTALPHLKIGNMVLQGEVTPLIGSEILLGLIRNQENPHNPSHPPLYSTSNRITFRPIDLWLKADAQTREQQKAPQHQKHYAQVPEEEAGRSMFLQRPAKNGPNRPTVFPGRQRDRVRAEKRAQKEGAQGSQEGTPVGEEDDDGKDEGVDADMSTPAPDVNDMDIDPALMDLNQAGRVTPAHGEAESAWAQSSASPMRGLTPTNHHEAEQMEMQMQGDMFSTPGAGPSTPALPSLDTVPDLHSTMFATGPRRGGHRNKTGRPRTRPVLEVHSADQIGSVNLGLLPDNVRILVSPLALDTAPTLTDDVPPQSLEFTKIEFRRLINGQPPRGKGSRGGPTRGRSGQSQTGTGQGPQGSPKLDVPYFLTRGTPTPASGALGAQPSPSPLRREQLPDPPEGLEPEARKDAEGVAEAETRGSSQGEQDQ